MKYSKKTLYLMENWGNTKHDFYKKEKCWAYVQGKKWLRENVSVGCRQ